MNHAKRKITFFFKKLLKTKLSAWFSFFLPLLHLLYPKPAKIQLLFLTLKKPYLSCYDTIISYQCELNVKILKKNPYYFFE